MKSQTFELGRRNLYCYCNLFVVALSCAKWQFPQLTCTEDNIIMQGGPAKVTSPPLVQLPCACYTGYGIYIVAVWIESQEHWTLRKRSSLASPIYTAFLSFLWTTTTVITTPIETAAERLCQVNWQSQLTAVTKVLVQSEVLFKGRMTCNSCTIPIKNKWHLKIWLILSVRTCKLHEE